MRCLELEQGPPERLAQSPTLPLSLPGSLVHEAGGLAHHPERPAAEGLFHGFGRLTPHGQFEIVDGPGAVHRKTGHHPFPGEGEQSGAGPHLDHMATEHGHHRPFRGMGGGDRRHPAPEPGRRPLVGQELEEVTDRPIRVRGRGQVRDPDLAGAV